MGAPHVLAVDLGTGGPKVALVGFDGTVAGWEFEDVELLVLGGGAVEQRPGDWWAAIMTAAKRLLERGLAPAEEIVAVACTSQWSGTVAVDDVGTPLMNAISWMDTRGSDAIRELVRGVPSIAGYGARKLRNWVRVTGGAPGLSGKDPLAHILWLRGAHADLYRSTYKFLEPIDWLGQQLTGRFAATYDSIAVHWVTDNRDVRNVRYDEGLLALAGIDRSKLPDLVPPASVLGPLRSELAHELGLSTDTVVVTGTGDVHSAAVGSGAVRDFEAHLYLGTSSWLTCHIPYKKTDLLHNIASIPSAVPGRYLVADEHETAGACLTFLRDNMFFPDDELRAHPAPPDVWRLLDRVVERTPAGSNKVLFTPWLQGERTPVEDHTVRASFVNLSLQTTRAEMIRAVYEGVAHNSRWLLDTVEKFTKRTLDPITMIGGGAASDVWCQIHADVLGRTVRQAAEPILANVRGAAFLAGIALGRVSIDDVAAEITRTFTPDASTRPVYDELYHEFVAFYRANKKMFARLNAH
ncbi:MAG: FGGY-family carbohydrate kinase [Acidimicrobiia bacterium]